MRTSLKMSNNLWKIIVLVAVFAIGPAITAANKPFLNRTFLDWCKDSTAPEEVKYTVKVILTYFGTNDCSQTQKHLKGFKQLNRSNVAMLSEFGLDDVLGPPEPIYNAYKMIAERPIQNLNPFSSLYSLEKLARNLKRVVLTSTHSQSSGY